MSLSATVILRDNGRYLSAMASCSFGPCRFIFSSWSGHGYLWELILIWQDLERRTWPKTFSP